jgi:hypothetical protein
MFAISAKWKFMVNVFRLRSVESVCVAVISVEWQPNRREEDLNETRSPVVEFVSPPPQVVGPPRSIRRTQLISKPQVS